MMSSLPEGMIRHKIKPDLGPEWVVWIVDSYYDFDKNGYTYVGGLIHDIKYGDGVKVADNVSRLRGVVRHSVLQLNAFPSSTSGFSGLNLVMAVPNNPEKTLSIPHLVADEAAKTLGIRNSSNEIEKTDVTPQAKFGSPLNPSAYKVDRSLNGQVVLLVDDVLGSGNTLESVAFNLREAGAKTVIGFVLAKTKVGMTNGN